MTALSLTSPAFEDGGRIPDEYGYRAENVNPPLEVDGIPDGTESLAIVMDDPDAMEPAGKVWDHWIVWNVPPDATSIPQDWRATDAVEGRNDYDEVGYGGPNPPDREHAYRFDCYALDTTLDLPAGSTKADVEAAIEGHVIERARLIGRYAP
ncbi:YbhB/YbcL family Raf kinase inhibitor-like protein [Halomarina pelagica]|uniref:YbhB/YbcL family Raf kinase inhibitor-like protein n=1 Tax=Halomarina pelagica TaxID=2961599 RepID=UPI0020C2536A|nr:YbhB/YbcL family Raf kinase inhibitor-like protein [Halomarina sp. BND7]